MAEFFEKWTPGQFTLLVMTVGIAVALVVFILSVTQYQMRALADQTALERERLAAGQAVRQELLRRNLPAADLRSALEALRLDEAAPAADADITGRALTGLMACNREAEVGADEVERTVAAVMAAGPAVRRAVAAVLDDAAENDYPAEPVFAAVRAVCQAGAKPRDLDLKFDRELAN